MLINSVRDSFKVRNKERDPRVAVSDHAELRRCFQVRGRVVDVTI